ncbi:MAG: PocR ligand-binding domain-containing protein [Lachnospiraceae bacterium]|nr:PocR ligand-binding domain-containing protein [Lachnospiraceae bacterium]
MRNNKPSKLDIKLIDLIDRDILQNFQDSFSDMTGMAALTTEADGKPITEGSNFTDYCMKYTRCSELGRSMCEECDRYGAEITMRTGKFTTYVCHSGLIDFSSPVIIDGSMVGCFIGGQVLSEPPDEAFIRDIARDLGINEDEYWDAIQKVPILPKEQIDKAAQYLYRISSVLSDMAYGKYLTIKANEELERAAKMQSDFLANMSHEIRTPMNAVIGFAEMALREDLSETAADYIRQIKNSGNSLLAIINDILDYSKIEAGKMDLIPVEYEPLSLIDDVANIIMTRLVDKDVELILDINPNIPTALYGDTVRLRQILINLCNNATKFTNEGYVRLSVDYEWAGYESVLLKCSVIDTGIGIKEVDLDKIFHSFQQVDSKRNRNIEGTGLGLSICKMLLDIMDGNLSVESVYGEGSTFSFEVPQKVVVSLPSVTIDDPENVYLGAALDGANVQQSFVSDAEKLGVNVRIFNDYDNRERDLKEWAKQAGDGSQLFFFLDQKYFDPDTLTGINDELNITPVVISDTFADTRELSEYTQLRFIRKPISVLNLGNLINDSDITHVNFEAGPEEIYNFTAEDANMLVVDDNIVNLTVAQGLLEPLKAKVDIATGGEEAIHMMEHKQYDIVFMDHMMPELDGVDTTRIIRRTMPQYKDVPIIALTANAVSEARELFKQEGMDGFIAKPVEVRVLVDTVRKFLPPEKIRRGRRPGEEAANTNTVSSEDKYPVIAELDTHTAIDMLGSKELYMNILRSYYSVIDTKANAIREYYEKADWSQYAIEVHALKSSSRQIGAMELGELAYKLEIAGKELDIATIAGNNAQLLNTYLALKDKLSYLFEENAGSDTESNATKPEARMEDLRSLFGKMRVAIDDLDMDMMEDVIAEMDKFSYSEFWQTKFDSLKAAVDRLDVDSCIEILDNWG